MIDFFESIIDSLLDSLTARGDLDSYDQAGRFEEPKVDDPAMAEALNAAFLVSMAGPTHPCFSIARDMMKRTRDIDNWKAVVDFYSKGVTEVKAEIESLCRIEPRFAFHVKDLADWMSNNKEAILDPQGVEKLWALFFPEGVGILKDKKDGIDKLRAKRLVNIDQLNPSRSENPVSEILFTSNVLLTIPAASTDIESLQLSDSLKQELKEISQEDQCYWYDHPIQIGVDQKKNEILYGLRGLDEAVTVEKSRGTVPQDSRITCVLSVSVTHKGLQQVARSYLTETIRDAGGLKNIDVYVFTEAAAREIIDTVLGPACEHYLSPACRQLLHDVFGVDGEYGRHYSFLKVIAAFWNLFIQPDIKATFKIDLDQVFPQEELSRETGASALEHLMSPLWGAAGTDSAGRPVELGMIAGALVNQKDIEKSIFTPDVPFPERPLAPDEHIFFSALPQALSTEAEMMTRYHSSKIDGQARCIQRIHVTGGTVGILVRSLRKHRPFTPSFIGRAEDQAYLLSTLNAEGGQLAYVHKDGLVMRHDKAEFAQEAIASAYVGKLIGDYIRILYFSAYAKVIAGDINKIKEIVDPFTGCFISKIPVTVVFLRFALKAAGFFPAQEPDKGVDFIRTGAQRIGNALDFIKGDNSPLKRKYEKERIGWNLLFDTLDLAEKGIAEKNDFALDMCEKAKDLIQQYLL